MTNKLEKLLTTPIIFLLIASVVVMGFNQYQISSLTPSSSSGKTSYMGNKDIANINILDLKSTGHTMAAVFPVEDITTQDDAMKIIFPTGTPDYGADLGVSFDDPVASLEVLARMYKSLKAEVETNNPEAWQRYLNLATKPVGISCEFCCGLNAIGIDDKGNSMCGCQHNPALLTVALYLTTYTDYSEGEILREVIKWKTLFFPKDMIQLGMTVAGGDTSSLDDLPGMVGGC